MAASHKDATGASLLARIMYWWNGTNAVPVDTSNPLPAGGNVASGATDAGNPLKVGGKYNSTSKLVGHFRHYSKKQLVDMVSKTELKIVWAYEWGFPFHSLYKYMLDQLPAEKQAQIGLGKYGFTKKLLSHILFGVFYFNRFDRGANVILLAKRDGAT